MHGLPHPKLLGGLSVGLPVAAQVKCSSGSKGVTSAHWSTKPQLLKYCSELQLNGGIATFFNLSSMTNSHRGYELLNVGPVVPTSSHTHAPALPVPMWSS